MVSRVFSGLDDSKDAIDLEKELLTIHGKLHGDIPMDQMNQSYFEEKQELAQESLSQSVEEIQRAATLIKAMNYSMFELVDSAQVHDMLKCAEGLIERSRWDFEKACWASAKTDLEFNDWLRERGWCDLV